MSGLDPYPAAHHPEGLAARLVPGRLRAVALFAVKAVHSLAFWVIQSAILFVIYKGLKNESDKRAAGAAALAAGETLIYVANGFRCPLTGLAEDLGSEHGQVTDIFLPRWLASNVDRIYGPLFALGLGLHLRNVLRRRPRAKPGGIGAEREA